MANNNVFLGELPPDLLNPRPEIAVRPTLLVWVGTFIAAAALMAFLSPPPDASLLAIEYAFYVFYVALAVLFVFGIGIIFIGWFAADMPEGCAALTRNGIRASQIMLVLAIALYEVYTKK